MKDPGITGLRFHDLRHTFASRFIAAGGNVVILSKILGHSTIALTYNRYCHPSDADMLRGVEMVAEKPSCRLEGLDKHQGIELLN
jgi:integrase